MDRRGLTLVSVLLSMTMLALAALTLIQVTLVNKRSAVSQDIAIETSAILSAVDITLQNPSVCSCILKGKSFSPRPGRDLQELKIPVEVKIWDEACTSAGEAVAVVGAKPAVGPWVKAVELEDFFAKNEDDYFAHLRVDVDKVAPNGLYGAISDSRKFLIHFKVKREAGSKDVTIVECARPQASHELIGVEYFYKPINQNRFVMQNERYVDARRVEIEITSARFSKPAPNRLVNPEVKPVPSLGSTLDPAMTPATGDRPVPKRLEFDGPGYPEPAGSDHIHMSLRLDFEKRELAGEGVVAAGPEGTLSTLYAFNQKIGFTHRSFNPHLGYACFWNHDLTDPICYDPSAKSVYQGLATGFSFRWESRSSRNLIFEDLSFLRYDQLWTMAYYR